MTLSPDVRQRHEKRALMKTILGLSAALACASFSFAAEPLYVPTEVELGAAGEIVIEPGTTLSGGSLLGSVPGTVDPLVSAPDGLEPIPDFVPGPQPGYVAPGPHSGYDGPGLPPAVGWQVMPIGPVPLYHNVKVVDTKRIPPEAVPMIVVVPNPCGVELEPVLVEICGLPHCEPQVKVGPLGQRVTFDFGSFRAQVVCRGGRVKIDYDN
jgi:hypothetical protein